MTRPVDLAAFRRTGMRRESSEKLRERAKADITAKKASLSDTVKYNAAAALQTAGKPNNSREEAEVKARRPRVTKGQERWHDLSDEERKAYLTQWRAENTPSLPDLEDGEEET